MGSRWTIEEDEFLEENWGYIKMEAISRKLNRTPRSLRHRASFLKLGGEYKNGLYLSTKQVAGLLKCDFETVRRWIDNGDLKARKRKTKNGERYLIKQESLADFLRNNPSKWNSLSLDVDENVLGLEVKWLREKRRLDIEKNEKFTFSIIEEQKLKELYLIGKSDKEISLILDKNYNTIKKKLKKFRENNEIPYRKQILDSKKHIIKIGDRFLAESYHLIDFKSIRVLETWVVVDVCGKDLFSAKSVNYKLPRVFNKSQVFEWVK